MPRKKAKLCLPRALETSPSVQVSDPSQTSPTLASWRLWWGLPSVATSGRGSKAQSTLSPPGPYPIGAYRCPACLHSPRGSRVVSKALWPASPGLSGQDPRRILLALRLRRSGPLLCSQTLASEALLSHPALGRRALSRRSPPSQPRLSTPPSPLSTIYLRLPRARNVPQDTVGLVPNPLLAHFPRAFTNWPPSHDCCLGFGSKEADRGPPLPTIPHASLCPNTGGGCITKGQGSLGWGRVPQILALLRLPALRCRLPTL